LAPALRQPQESGPAPRVGGRVARLRYRTTRERLGNPEFEIWSFAHITDLRTQAERGDGM